MSLLPVRRQPRSLFPEFADLFDGFPTFAALRPLAENHLIRVEDEVSDGAYIVRAEMPGLDMTKDVDVTVRDGELTIKAERSEKKESKGRSEFTYGSFVRTISLPQNANEDDIKATYDKGILTVTVELPKTEEKPEKRVEVQTAG